MKKIFDILNKVIMFGFLALAVTSCYYFVFKSSYYHYILKFDEPVDGLTAGAEVYVGGMASGHVQSVTLDKPVFDKSTVVLDLNIEIDPKHAIAQLTMNGLASIKSISIFYSNEPSVLPNIDGMRQIKVQKSPINLISKFLRDQQGSLNVNVNQIVTDVQKCTNALNGVVDKIRGFVDNSVETLEQTDLVNFSDKTMHIVNELFGTLNNLHQASIIILKELKTLKKKGNKNLNQIIEDAKDIVSSTNQAIKVIKKSRIWKYVP